MNQPLPLILAKLRDVMEEAPPEARPRLLAALLVEVPLAPVAPTLAAAPADTELLTPEDAAKVGKVSARTLLRLTRGQSFRRQLGHRTVRFEMRGLQRWVENRAGR